MNRVGGKFPESCLGCKIVVSIGDVSGGIVQALEFRSEVRLEVEFGQSSAYRWF